MLYNLKKLRREHQVSQAKLADAIGVSQQSINKYENHNIEPDIETLVRIADYFSTSVDYIVGHTDIDRRIEPMEAFDLNPDEARVIASYRKLTPSQREAVVGVMRAFLAP